MMSRYAGLMLCALALQVMAATADASGVDPLSGDWRGTLTRDGQAVPLVAQVIALGAEGYRVNMLAAFDTREAPLCVMRGKADASGVVLSGANGDLSWNATLQPERFSGTVSAPDGTVFSLQKIERLSPTMGKRPPEGAVVLFDGTSTDAWHHEGGKPCRWAVVDGAMVVTPKSGSLYSKQVFTGDHDLHIEFRSPFQPDARGQGRGNSGVYVQGMYEVQVLDSYGLEGRDNECGGIYKVAAPRVNMCAPPMQWQTYDISFTAPTFDAEGKKLTAARLTVDHNGVRIHENQDVPRPTGASSRRDESNPNGLHLQDHGNLVQYRNIWVVDRSGTR